MGGACHLRPEKPLGCFFINRSVIYHSPHRFVYNPGLEFGDPDFSVLFLNLCYKDVPCGRALRGDGTQGAHP